MTHLYLRLTFIPILLFTAMLILIHAQPYDDHELRQLLLPEGCPAPCFMGIRPGVTTVEEAIRILDGSGWVETNEPNPSNDDFGDQISFEWNGKQPDLIMGHEGFVVGFSRHFLRVTQMSFRLQENLRVGDLYLALGMPSSYRYPSMRLLNMGDTPYGLILFHQYESTFINLITFTNCPVKLSRLLNQPLKLIQYNFYPQTVPFSISRKQLLQFHDCDGN